MTAFKFYVIVFSGVYKMKYLPYSLEQIEAQQKQINKIKIELEKAESQLWSMKKANNAAITEHKIKLAKRITPTCAQYMELMVEQGRCLKIYPGLNYKRGAIYLLEYGNIVQSFPHKIYDRLYTAGYLKVQDDGFYGDKRAWLNDEGKQALEEYRKKLNE